MSLLAVEEAQARLLALAPPLPIEHTPLIDATGRWLAEDLLALRDQPFADLSAMDGYAIRFADLPGPWRVTTTSAAGGPAPASIGPGEAARIFTGAPMPPGADTVILQEDVSADGTLVTLTGDAPSRSGRHVRHKGHDFARDATLAPAGTCLSPAHIGLAAVAGHGALPVRRRPRVALLSTGSELTPPGVPAAPDRLPASNGVMLAAMLARLPCVVRDHGIVADDLAAITTALTTAAADADILVTTGGASVGDHDLVRPALEQAGGSLDFWKIRMRPGKPLICGTVGSTILLGLPGNPVSAFTTAHLFLLPLVRHLAGSSAPLPPRQLLPLAAPIEATGSRDTFLRACLTDAGVLPLTEQDSAALLALSRCDCLIHRPAHAPAAQAGEMVSILPLR